MAVAQGYGKTVTSGSVFAYDVADTRNSYIGKPGYNVTGTPVAWVGNQNASDFKTTVGTTTVNIPAIGTREVQYVDIWNTGASNCCPSLWRYGNWGITTGVSGNTLYTYSIIYKTKSGYTHPNFMYRYEYNGGSYITEVGVFDTAKRIDLGDGWYQAYNTFTTNASTNTLYLGMWYYQYNVYDTVYLYKASLTQGNHVFSPEQIIPPSTTRSNTQGLLPLVGNSTLDLTNVSFDSNAQMTFDGTNDYFSSGYDLSWNNSNSVSIEFIIKRSGTGGGFLGKEYPNWEWSFYLNTAAIQLIYWTTAGGHANGMDHSTSQFMTSTSSYYHVIYAWNGSVSRWYVNSALDTVHTATDPSLNQNRSNNVMVGGHTYVWADSFATVQLPVLKFYTRALSAAEVRQNYLHYKTRFNLS